MLVKYRAKSYQQTRRSQLFFFVIVLVFAVIIPGKIFWLAQWSVVSLLLGEQKYSTETIIDINEWQFWTSVFWNLSISYIVQIFVKVSNA